MKLSSILQPMHSKDKVHLAVDYDTALYNNNNNIIMVIFKCYFSGELIALS